MSGHEPKKKTRWALAGGIICVLSLITCSGLFSVILGVIKSSDAYLAAVTRAKADPRVKAVIGEPIGEGFIPAGEVKTVNGHETADLRISLAGPKGAGVLQVRCSRDGEKREWTYQQLTFGPDEAKPIDLLEAPPADQPAAADQPATPQ